LRDHDVCSLLWVVPHQPFRVFGLWLIAAISSNALP
jgi:hypothetical protein